MHPAKTTADIKENILIRDRYYILSKCKWFFTTHSAVKSIKTKEHMSPSIPQRRCDHKKSGILMLS